MASAEAVKAGFDLIRDRARAASANATPTEGDAHVPVDAVRAIIVATVQGDIHDIGKNIVKMLLENYGFTVIDLGRDVAPEAIVAAGGTEGVDGVSGATITSKAIFSAVEDALAQATGW